MTLDFSSSVRGSIFDHISKKNLEDSRPPAPDSPWPLVEHSFAQVITFLNVSETLWHDLLQCFFGPPRLLFLCCFFAECWNIVLEKYVRLILPNPDLIWCSNSSSTSGFLLRYCKVTRCTCILITANWIYNFLLILALSAFRWTQRWKHGEYLVQTCN